MTALPDKEVVSILDLNADIDLAIDAAAPIDLAVAANANVAAPIDAAVSANMLSSDSTAQALSDQGVMITQGIDADATATAEQDSVIDQGNDVIDDGTADGRGRGTALPPLPRAPDAPARRRTSTADGAVDGAVDGATGAVGRRHRRRDGGASTGPSAAVDGDCATERPAADRRPGRHYGRRRRGGRRRAGGLDGRCTRPATCSTWTSTWTRTPTSPLRSTARWLPTPTSLRRSMPRSQPTSAAMDSDAVAVSQQDAIIDQQVTGSAEATSDQASDITQ